MTQTSSEEMFERRCVILLIVFFIMTAVMMAWKGCANEGKDSVKQIEEMQYDGD